jgi:hypothetical protein
MYAVDVDRIPVAITDLMEHFTKRVNVNAIRLAGGAPRDLLLGAEVSDWDFFIPTSYSPTTGFDLGHIGFRLQGGEKSPYIGEKKIFDTYTWIHKTGPKVQLIFSDQQIEDFDISTCQVALDMHGKVYVTDAFERAISYRVHCVYLRTYQSLYQLTHGLFDHVPRVLAKYPWPIRFDMEGVTKKQIEFLKNSTLGDF